MSLILPKGIVVNSDKISEDIGSIALEPLDQAEIAKFWKVYTTTKRRLLDPTAERLENYWWRIWYSDKKSLDAATVARLFAHISDGPTFVPLRGPPNRVDETTPPNTSVRHGQEALSTTVLHQPRQSGPSTGTTTTASSSTTSRAPAPMPHPILKKTRGPSTGGARPTARFISPHESEHEEEESLSISPNSHVVVQPPSPDPRGAKSDRRGTAASNKKKSGFAASTKKKRPVIVRRQSSQTSQSSVDFAAKDADAAKVALESRPSLDGPQQSAAKAQSRFQENFSPSPEKFTSIRSSKKQTGESKRSPPRKTSTETGHTAPNRLSEEAISPGDPGPSTQLRRIENLPGGEEPDDLIPEELGELEMQRILLAETNARVQKDTKPESGNTREYETERVRVLHKSLRSKSAGNLVSEELDAIRLMRYDPKGIPSLAPTLADATGQVDISDADASESQRSTTPAKGEKGKGRAPEEQKQVDMFAKRPVEPVKATPATDSMSRSKSQLTLLLRHDKEKNNRNKHGSEKDKKKK